jgi:YVTN family beta-propeller protein
MRGGAAGTQSRGGVPGVDQAVPSARRLVADSPTVATVDTGDSPQRCVLSADGTKLYVAVYGGFVKVYNASTRDLVTDIACGLELIGLDLSPDGTRLYACNGADGTVSVIDTETDAVIDTITVAARPTGTAFTPDSATAFVSCIDGNEVKKITVATGAVAATITPGGGPEAGTVNAAGTLLYVPIFSNNVVEVYDTTSNALVATITGFSNPFRVLFLGAARAYVSNRGNDEISIIDTDSGSPTYHQITGTIFLGDTDWFCMAASADLARVYVTNFANGVAAIDAATDSIIGNLFDLPANCQGIALAESDARLWLCQDGGTLYYLDTAKIGADLPAPELSPSDEFVLIENTEPITVALPDASACADGRIRRYVRIGPAQITFDGGAANVAGAPTATVAANATLAIWSDGDDWWRA